MANNNKHTGPNVPALRFPEFSGEWERKALSEFVDRVTRRNKGLKSTRPLTISAQFGLVDQTEFFKKSVAGADLSNYYLLSKGEFAYNKSYSDGYPLGAIKRLDRYDSGVLSSLYICFVPKPYMSSDYLVQYFESTKWNQVVKDISGEGARNHGLLNVPVTGFFETQHYIPKRDEQEKLGAFLTLIEKRIATQSKIIEEQETLLKSLADKLISAQSANVAICGCVDAKASTMKEGELESHGAFPVFGASGLCGYSNEALEESDSILVTKDGSGVGTCQYATGAHSFLGTLCSLTAKKGVYLPYVYYALLNFNFASFKTGLAIPHIYFKDYGKAVIYCPSYDEQVRIASGIEKIEAKIKSDKELLKQYQLQKEYLLSRMFI